MKINVGRLVACVVGVELIGNIGSLATFSQITTWYTALDKPSFNPPNAIFGPAWTLLYALMGVALSLVLAEKNNKRAITLFAIQLALNVLWSFIFFGWHAPGWAFVEIIVLWIAILATIIEFKKLSTTAAWLMVPYLAWVTFAAVLNFAVWRLN